MGEPSATCASAQTLTVSLRDRSKGDVQESVLGAEGDEGAAEAGPSTGENVDEDEVDEGE